MKIKNLVTAAMLAASGASFGAVGIFDSFVFTTSTGNAPLNFFDIGASTPNPDFQGANLGTFTVGNTFFIGGQQKSFKNNGSDVTGHSISWRVYSGSPSGTFVGVNMPFQNNIGGGGDQQWGGDTSGSNADPVERSTNVLAGLPNGNYSLQVFSAITTNSVDAPATFSNNAGGANFTASFVVIPEPATATLGLLGAVMLLRRRRI